MVSGRLLGLPALGIRVRRDRPNLKRPARSSLEVLSIHSLFIPSSVSLLEPGVIFPGLDLITS
jgi:hypothetical protein